MRIASIVGARPNFVKLAPMHRALKDVSEHTIIHTGQHYDYNLSKIFFKEFDLPEPNYDLEVGSSSAGAQIGEMIKRLDGLFTQKRFDIVLVYGDTNSTIAGAIAANKCNIKIGHIESGLRSRDRNMPEEINRILTDHVSDYLFAPTDNALYNLIDEKVSGHSFCTGDLSVEIVLESQKVASNSQILKDLNIHNKECENNEIDNTCKKEYYERERSRYILLTIHRAENTSNIENIKSIIKAIELLTEFEFVFPIHPRTKKFILDNNLFEDIQKIKNLRLIEPVGYIDFISLLANSYKIITDSGGAQKEAYILGIPCITIRNNTEWVETVNEGWNILTGTNYTRIIDAVRRWNPVKETKGQRRVFGKGNTSIKILEIIKNVMESRN